MDIKSLKQLAHNIRLDIVKAAFSAGKNGSHLGGCLSLADLLAVLYGEILQWESNDIENRDRVIMSKGHGALALYATLHQKGILTDAELLSFEHNGSEFTAHAHRNISRGIEFTGGSLGLGFTFAVGVALACKMKGLCNRIYCFLGDGELNEGIVWEALMFASHKKLSNLTIIVDHNHLQIGGNTEDVLDMNPIDKKFTSFGCKTMIVDGHNVEDIRNAFNDMSIDKPTVIIAETIKGKGLKLTENKYKWHFGVLTEQRYNRALEELGGSYE